MTRLMRARGRQARRVESTRDGRSLFLPSETRQSRDLTVAVPRSPSERPARSTASLVGYNWGKRVSRLAKGKRDVDGRLSTVTHGGSRGKSRWSRLHGDGCNGRARKGDRQRIRPARRDRRGGGPRRGAGARAPGDRPGGGGGRGGRAFPWGELPPLLP